MSQVTQARAA